MSGSGCVAPSQTSTASPVRSSTARTRRICRIGRSTAGAAAAALAWGVLQAYGMWGGESLATPRGCGSAQPTTKGPTKLTSKRVSMGLPDLKQSTRMPAAGVQKFTLHCAELLPYAVTWTLPLSKKSGTWIA